ncbi:hypothetical protein CTEN210_09797 [Chaetoceros tenuissimus]|uniref:Leucine-rich repeat domain-containing protein n=1 Tax=Chaetoceros tenuissimus TaxID=426638 RepID=A0AAD3CW61_9STRA|nr:hypothetical protein CTEN210_09797 [Chaetoceros tenuissimus]
MRVATVDRLVTLFYDGSKELYNEELANEWWEGYNTHNGNIDDWKEWNLSDECKAYWRERQTWKQIIVVEGVTVIPQLTFHHCKSIKRVIMADTVVRIEPCAFGKCSSLVFIKLSIYLEYIGVLAFKECDLFSVFIPPRCREIGAVAFYSNKNLTIFNVPRDTEIRGSVIFGTKLLHDSHFELNERGSYHDHTEEVHNWLKNMNNDNKYSLHRACSSFQPLKEVLLTIVRAKGIGAFTVKNEADITPSKYLRENPYADIEEMDIVRDYVMKMMGEYN